MFLNVGDKIVFMQALHDDDNSPIFLAVEAAARSVVIPFLQGPAAGFRQGVVRLKRVVDNDDVRSAAREDTTYGRRKSISAVGRFIIRDFRARLSERSCAYVTDKICLVGSCPSTHAGKAIDISWDLR